MVRINQLTPALHENDAVGESILEIHNTLQEWDYESNIFSLTVDESLKSVAKDLSELKNYDDENSINILHFAIPSPLTQAFKTSTGKKILIYHNITPPEFFEGISREMVHISNTGRSELSSLSDCTDLALGDSKFNEQELKTLNFKDTGVFPILLNSDRYNIETLEPLKFLFKNDGYKNILFTGRITPNKKIEDVIKCFYYYQNLFQEKSRLLIVGNPTGFESYDLYLKDLADKMDLVEVYFTGKVDQDELISFFEIADLFITMSEHEGFCVPILESFIFEIPVIAYNSTAIPYTMGDGGVLVNEKNFKEIAGIMSEVIENEDFRKSIIQKQKNQLEKFSPAPIKEDLKKFLSSFI